MSWYKKYRNSFPKIKKNATRGGMMLGSAIPMQA
jgi:hypothetical protein